MRELRQDLWYRLQGLRVGLTCLCQPYQSEVSEVHQPKEA